VCSIAAFLREKGYEVRIICQKEDRIDYREIKEFNPGIIGITVYSYTKKAAYNFCTRARREVPDAYICAGGYLPTYFGEEMLKEAPFIDFVIRREGEVSFLELITRLEKGEDVTDVKGLTYRGGGEIVVNEDQPLMADMDALPFPARDVLKDHKLKIASVMTTRGCLRKCRFCNTANFWKKWRGKSTARVLEEIKSVYDMGVRYFSFNDSSFEDSAAHLDRIVQLARGILDLNLDISYIAGFRAEFNRDTTPELMELLKKSGLRQVRIGIETGNEFDRKLYGKWASLDDNRKIIRLFQDYNIYPRVGFINFNPYSTFDGLGRNIDFLEETGWAANFFTISSRLTVFRGTGLFEKVKNDGLMIGENTDAPQYKFTDRRIPNLANYLHSYFYLLDRETKGAPGKICNYKNYFQSIVYDFRERFAGASNNGAYQLVMDFQGQVKGILGEVNRRNARWFRELLNLAQNGWNNKTAFAVSSQYLNKMFLLETVAELEEKKSIFSSELRSMGSDYDTWIHRTWDIIGNLKL
jgi:radical SAM superfamily enzyme YgiQ (UPF0313 family)